MNLNQAMTLAARQVQLNRFGNGWQVSVYDTNRAAWYEHGATDWSRASSAAREARISAALALVGIGDSGRIAFMTAEDSGDWRAIVRREFKKATQ